MKIVTLDNGLKVIYEYKKSNSIVIQVNVKVGSNYENKNNLGICHFIEHMLFEGTKKRDARKIASEVEAMGGEINACTMNERTIYYVSVLKKHFEKGLDVLADMIQNSLFKEDKINKEKRVVLDEIDVHHDDPNSYQFILFLKNLYKKHPAKHHGLGTKETVSKFTRKQIVDFYRKYYAPNNISIIIVGDVENSASKVEKAFRNFEKKKVLEYKKIIEPVQTKIKSVTEKRDIDHSYYVFGYKTVPRTDKKSYVLDVISHILGYGQSCRLFNEIRTKRGLGYNVGVSNDLNTDYGYFAVFVTVNKKGVPVVKKIILDEIKLNDLGEKEVEQAKEIIEGSTLIRNEGNKERAEWISYWELMGNLKDADDYFKKVKKVTKKDVLDFVKKYFTKNYTEVILEEN